MHAAPFPPCEIPSNPRLLDQILAPAIHLLGNYVRGVYREGPLDDFRFVRLGICRVLSQAASGRDFLQMAREVFGEEVARASFFDSLHCRRRSQVLADLNAQLVTRNRSGLEDLLARFPELQDIPVYAVDGHHIDHAVHSPSDPKGGKVSANNLYLLCLHTGFLWNLGAVQGDGRHGHELPVFRNQIVPWLLTQKPGKGQAAPIFVGDPAFVDKVFWTRMVLEGGRARFITRTKSNMKPMIYSAYGWNGKNLVNEGVQADLSVGFDGSITLRLIRYRDPESGVDYEFLTSVKDLQPGLIALLYLTRWRIEKLFDTTKNKLEETKCWAVGPVAQETRAHLVALTHNLLVLLRGELEGEHGIREEKVERKRQAQLRQRQTQARALGRTVAALQQFLPVAIQMTAQFIRTLRNGILLGMRWARALELLRAATKSYL
jgi:Transposase DDE domain